MAEAPTEGAIGHPPTAATAAAPVRSGEAPLGGHRRIGPYAIQGLLGSGGMGVVYRGVHAESGEAVAIKTVSTLRASRLSSLRSEFHALSELRHPGVVRTLGSGIEDGIPWYAMELLRGRTLHDHLAELWEAGDDTPTGALHSSAGPAPQARVPAGAGQLRAVLTLLRRLCEPLAYIHARGVVHRDLKPGNVFLRPDGWPVLMDFGLAAQHGGAAGREVLDVRGMAMGTGWYMAPEQAEGQLVDARADLYSLGVILYELVTGQRPFTGRSTGEVIEQHRSQPVRPPSELVDGVSPGLDELALRLLAKRRRERIGHADDVAEALGALGAEGRPTTATPAYLYRPELEGRAGSLQQLRQELGRLDEGRGCCLLLGGESGVGKTTLAAALARRARQAGFAVVTGECRSLGEGALRAAPLHPLAPLLLAVADHCLESGPGETARILGPRGKMLERYLPALGGLPGQSDHEVPRGLSTEAARDRLREDLAGVLGAYTAGRPLLLVLDDLQWADELTLDFLASLPTAFFERTPLVVLGTYRSEEPGALRELLGAGTVRDLRLDRLDRSAVHGMVGGMLALAEPDEKLVDFLSRHSEGNPFFVAEYLRTAVAERLLFRESGSWRLVRPPGTQEGDLALPRSLRELVGRRLAGLGARAEELLSAACVLGREFDAELLAAATGAEEAALIGMLAELQARAVVETTAEGGLRFAHDKLREVAYGRLGAEARRELHGRAARALEQRFAGSELRAGELAHHWEEAGDAARARGCFELAGAAALRSGACREAEGALRRALAHDEDLRTRGAGLPAGERARVERLLGEAHYGLGRFPEARDQVDRGLRCLGSSIPRAGGELLRGLLGQMARQSWHRLRGLDPLAGAAPAEAPEPVLAWHSLVHVFFHTEEMGHYVHANLSLLNRAEQAGPSAQLAEAYALTCLLAGSLSLHGPARWYWQRALDTVARLDSPAAEASVLMITSIYGTGACHWARVREATARGAALAERIGDHRRFAENTALSANEAFYAGDLERALGLWAALLARARQSQPRCWALCGAGENLLRRDQPGDAAAALRHYETALGVLQSERLAIADEIRIRGGLALARLHNGDVPGALQAAEEARERIVAHPRTTAFWTIEGASAAADVLLHGERPDGGRIASARAVCRGLTGYASVYPVGRSRALLCEGRRLALSGEAAAARKSLERAVAAADALALPHDGARARLALCALLPDPDPRREPLRREAEQTLLRMGAAIPTFHGS